MHQVFVHQGLEEVAGKGRRKEKRAEFKEVSEEKLQS
jgi:hypothetical protein